MDDLDKKILALLSNNARATIKEIAAKVSLTSPAVSERVRRLERTGVIDGYTVRLNPGLTRGSVRAVISIYVPPPDRERFLQLVLEETAVEECLQVTGNQSHMVLARCKDIEALEALVSRLQKLGQTNTQIILSALKSK
ncbi:MAG: Lrp/AsnC family transcriptional regulator [Ruminococcaceae bacterium]|nr:Lrp/AsnC family transcriptional regulator [Oscillospiraceae bacterium]